MEALVVFCTFPDRETGERILATLVEERRIACGTLIPGASSVYRWEGKIERATEALALLKTTGPCWEPLRARLRELHPYAVPEIVAVPASRVDAEYGRWIEESVAPGERA